MTTRLVKVKAHCGEPLNEAADALASAAAETDAGPMTGEMHLNQGAVHFYLAGPVAPVEWDTRAPVEWDTRVCNYLTHASSARTTAQLSEPRRRRDGTDVIPPITTTWMMRLDQGRPVLGAVRVV